MRSYKRIIGSNFCLHFGLGFLYVVENKKITQYFDRNENETSEVIHRDQLHVTTDSLNQFPSKEKIDRFFASPLEFEIDEDYVVNNCNHQNNHHETQEDTIHTEQAVSRATEQIPEKYHIPAILDSLSTCANQPMVDGHTVYTICEETARSHSTAFTLNPVNTIAEQMFPRLRDQLSVEVQSQVAVAARRLLESQDVVRDIVHWVSQTPPPQLHPSESSLTSTGVKPSDQTIPEEGEWIVPDEYKCPLCYDIMMCPFNIECGHSFCGDCLDDHLAASSECPVCRHSLSRDFGNHVITLDNIILQYVQSLSDSRQKRIWLESHHAYTAELAENRLRDLSDEMGYYVTCMGLVAASAIVITYIWIAKQGVYSGCSVAKV